MDPNGFDFPKNYVLMSVLFTSLSGMLCTLSIWLLGGRRILVYVLPLAVLLASALAVIFYNRRHGRPALFGFREFGLVLFYDDRDAPLPDLEGFDLSMRAYLAVLGLSVGSYIASLFLIPFKNWDITAILLPLFVFLYTEAALVVNNLRKGRPPFCGQVRFFKALAANQI